MLIWDLTITLGAKGHQEIGKKHYDFYHSVKDAVTVSGTEGNIVLLVYIRARTRNKDELK